MFNIPRTRGELRVQLRWLTLSVVFMLAAGAVNSLPGELAAAHYGAIGWAMFIGAAALIANAFIFGTYRTGLLVIATIIVPTLTTQTFMNRAVEAGEASPLAFTMVGVAFVVALLLPAATEMAESAIHGIHKRTQSIFFTSYAITPLSTLAWFVTGAEISGYMLLPVAGLIATAGAFRLWIPHWLAMLKANTPLPQSQDWKVVEP